jgi:hypothetical protein
MDICCEVLNGFSRILDRFLPCVKIFNLLLFRYLYILKKKLSETFVNVLSCVISVFRVIEGIF